MIEYFRLHIEYLWNAVNLKKTEHSDSLNIQFSIINSQFRLVRVRTDIPILKQPTREENKMKKRFLLSVLVFAICIVPFAAKAGEAGNAKQVTCAAIKVFECTSANGCQEVTAEAIDMPQMFRIDFNAKTITGIVNGKERITRIEYLEYIDGKLMLYGAEDGRKDQKEF